MPTQPEFVTTTLEVWGKESAVRLHFEAGRGVKKLNSPIPQEELTHDPAINKELQP